MQALQLLVIFVTSTLAIDNVTIHQFSASLFNGSLPTIFNDSIGLSIKVSGCQLTCLCEVQTNGTGNWQPMEFFKSMTDGSLIIKNLTAYTFYSFVVNCSGANEVKTYVTRTDVSHPSAPRDVTLTLNGQRLRLTWSPPLMPRGPISEYRVTVDGQEVTPPLSDTTLSYQLKEDYVQGTERTLAVRACNTDTQGRPYCSNVKDAETSYPAGSLQTSTSTTTTTDKPPSQLAPTMKRSRILLSLTLILIVKFKFCT